MDGNVNTSHEYNYWLYRTPQMMRSLHQNAALQRIEGSGLYFHYLIMYLIDAIGIYSDIVSLTEVKESF